MDTNEQGAPVTDLRPVAKSVPGELALTPETVFRDHAPRVYSLVRRMLNSDADAEDVTQDVLVTVVSKLPTFRGEAAFPTWLHRVAVNAALAHRRKQAIREEGRIYDPLESFATNGHHHSPVSRWSVGPEQAVLDQETHQIIEQAIAQLPSGYRDVYVLADVEEMPNAEIGTLLGLSLAAVKSRLHRARLLLREALAPHFEEVSA